MNTEEGLPSEFLGLPSIDYAYLIEKNLRKLRELYNENNLTVNRSIGSEDLKTLIIFSMMNITKCDYHRVCKNFDIPFSESISEILMELLKDWDKRRGMARFYNDLKALVELYTFSRFGEISEENYFFIKDVLKRLRACGIGYTIQEVNAMGTSEEGQYVERLLNERIGGRDYNFSCVYNYNVKRRQEVV